MDAGGRVSSGVAAESKAKREFAYQLLVIRPLNRGGRLRATMTRTMGIDRYNRQSPINLEIIRFCPSDRFLTATDFDLVQRV